MACLHPHNYISNVVVSLTIHDDTNIFIDIEKSERIRICVCMYTRMCIYMYIFRDIESGLSKTKSVWT